MRTEKPQVLDALRPWADPQDVQLMPLRSRQGHVWRVDVRGEPRFVIKCCNRAALERERAGLQTCARASLRAPRLEGVLAHDTLLCTWLPGRRGCSEARHLGAAGAWLARLHAIAHDDDDALSLEDAFAMRATRWAQRARDVLPAHWIDRTVHACEGLALGSRVWCHRDFVPEHWRIDPSDGLGVLDFGQSRLDAAAWDLVKLAAHWSDDQRAAFMRGYGSPPASSQAMSALVSLHGLQTAIWGHEHSDPHFSALGRSILREHLGPA